MFCFRCRAAYPAGLEPADSAAVSWTNSRWENLEDPEARQRHQLRFDVSELWGRRMLTFFSEHACIGAGALLDLGCGPGGAMHAFAKSGWQTKGVDVDVGLKVHHAEYGLEVDYQTIESALSSPRKKFDLVVCSHVLYFVQRPNELFKALPALVGLNGYALLVISDLLSCRSNSVPSVNHSWYPTLKSVENLLMKEGFTIVRSKRVSGSYFVLGRNEGKTGYRQLPIVLGFYYYLRMITQPLRSRICSPVIALVRRMFRRSVAQS